MTQPFASAHVTAELDWGNLDRELEERVRRAAQRAATVLRRELRRFSFAVDVSVSIDHAAAAAQLAALTRDRTIEIRPNIVGGQQNVTVEANLDLTRAMAQLQTFRDAVALQPLALNVNLDTTAALAQLAALRAAASTLTSNLGAGGGARGAGAARALGRLTGGPIRRILMRIEIDRASIARAQADVERVANQIVTARVRESEAADRVRLAQTRLNEVNARGVATAQQMADAEGRVRLLRQRLIEVDQRANVADSTRIAARQALMRAQRELAQLSAGGGGSESQRLAAVQNLQRAQETLNERTREHHRLLGEQADAHNRLTSSQREGSGVMRLVYAGLGGLAESARNVGGAILGTTNPINLAMMALVALAAVSLLPLIGQIGHAVAALAALAPAAGFALAGIVAAVAIGGNGIIDAFKAMSKASQSSAKEQAAQAKQIASALRQVEHAERALGDARENANRTASDGQRQILSSSKTYTQAVKGETDAQKDVARARRDARRELEDLNDSMREGALSEADAQLSLAEARRDLANFARENPKADALDRQRAVLRVQQAEERLNKTRRDNTRLVSDAAEANRKGVEGSDRVVDARRKQADATEAVTEAEENLKRTREDVARANADAQQRIADAQRAVSDAQHAVREAQAETSASVDDLAAKLAKLSPNARDFVEKTSSIGGAWTKLRMTVQDALFERLGDGVVKLANQQLPVAEKGIAGFASVLNGAAQRALDFLSTPTAQTELGVMFENTRKGVDGLVHGLGDLGAILWDVAVVGSNFLPGLGEGFKQTGESWRDAVHRMRESGELEKFIGTGLEKAGTFIDIIGKLGKTILEFFKSTNESGESQLEMVLNGVNSALQWMADPGNQEMVAGFFNDLTTTMGALGATFGWIIKIAAFVVEWMDKILGGVNSFGIIESIFTERIPQIGEGLTILFDRFKNRVSESFETVQRWIGSAIDWLRDWLDRGGNFVDRMRDRIASAFDGIGGIFRGFADIARTVWDTVVRTIAIGVKAVGEMLARVPTIRIPGTSIQIGPDVKGAGAALVEWATAHGAATGGIATGTGRIERRVGGGRLVTGPGTSTSDSILAMLGGRPIALSDKEFISTAEAYRNGAPLLWALNNGWKPSPEFVRALVGGGMAGFKSGGIVTDDEIARMGGGTVNLSILRALRSEVPGAVLTSAKTDHSNDGGFHPRGQAIDVDPTRANLDYLWSIRNKLTQIIFDDPEKVWYNVAGERAEGAAARAIYGEATMAQHGDHIHVAAGSEVGIGDNSQVPSMPVDERTEIARKIIAEGRRQGVSDKGIKVALATALAETGLRNLANPNDPDSLKHPHSGVGTDHDSAGVFQQRPSWGSAAQRMDPTQAAALFYEQLKKIDYENMDPAAAAQKVQRSAFADGSNYRAKLGEAEQIFNGAAGSSPSASSSSAASSSDTSGAQRVFVINWPDSFTAATESAAAAVAQLPPPSGPPPGPSPLATNDPLLAGAGAAAPGAGVDAANAWAAQQDFRGQFEQWGIDALKSIVGEFADPFGLKSLTDMGIDNTVAALRRPAQEIKVADTVNFYGMDPARTADANARMLRDRMAPVAETYRAG